MALGLPYLAAFSTRLVSTCSTLSGSAYTRGRSVGERHGAVELGDRHAHLLDHGASEGREVDHLPAQHQAAGLQPADVEQLGDQPGDAVGVVVDLLEHRALLLVLQPVPAVQHQRRVALHRGERAPELVGHGGDDRDAAPLARRAAARARCGRPPRADRGGDRHVGAVGPPEHEVDLPLGGRAARCAAPGTPPPLRTSKDSPTGCPMKAAASAPSTSSGGRVQRHERAVLVEHEHRVGQQVERDLGHRAARRCRSDSKHSTEPAIATLSDSERPSIGMVRRSSTAARAGSGEAVGLAAEHERDRPVRSTSS